MPLSLKMMKFHIIFLTDHMDESFGKSNALTDVGGMEIYTSHLIVAAFLAQLGLS